MAPCRAASRVREARCVSLVRKGRSQSAPIASPCAGALPLPPFVLLWQYKRYPLHAAASQGQVEMVEALLNMGADVDVQDAVRGPPLQHQLGAELWGSSF